MKGAFKKFNKRRHHYMMLFWIAMIPITLIWLKDSILWLAMMSLYANIEASAAAKEADSNEE